MFQSVAKASQQKTMIFSVPVLETDTSARSILALIHRQLQKGQQNMWNNKLTGVAMTFITILNQFTISAMITWIFTWTSSILALWTIGIFIASKNFFVNPYNICSSPRIERRHGYQIANQETFQLPNLFLKAKKFAFPMKKYAFFDWMFIGNLIGDDLMFF